MSRVTNFEKYKDEILSITDSGRDFAFVDDNICVCDNTTDCPSCTFGEPGCTITDCYRNRGKWLCSYAAPALTKREYAFCEYVQTGYVTRNHSNALYWSEKRPEKTPHGWEYPFALLFQIYLCNFDFIEYDDEEPWEVEDLLKLEVEE